MEISNVVSIAPRQIPTDFIPKTNSALTSFKTETPAPAVPKTEICKKQTTPASIAYPAQDTDLARGGQEQLLLNIVNFASLHPASLILAVNANKNIMETFNIQHVNQFRAIHCRFLIYSDSQMNIFNCSKGEFRIVSATF
ncbi:MAG: hypothetical protein COB78_03005 [Hyphomicrobiales bacterium]|nr:MAG: hypothetical protein COB78_03005 [Hyphomicrobiales bacterium]